MGQIKMYFFLQQNSLTLSLCKKKTAYFILHLKNSHIILSFPKRQKNSLIQQTLPNLLKSTQPQQHSINISTLAENCQQWLYVTVERVHKIQ
jgi:hypothetical protein